MPLPPKIKDLVENLNLISHPERRFYRSGSVPISSKGKTNFDCKDPEVNLVTNGGVKRDVMESSDGW